MSTRCERNGKRKRADARHPDALPARAIRIAKSEERFRAKAEEG